MRERPTDSTLVGLLWVSPWLVGFILFLAAPIILSFVYSLTDFPLLEPPLFVGFEQYSRLFRDPIFLTVVRNTLIYAAVAVPLGAALAVGLAVLLQRTGLLATLGRAVVFLPSLVPVAAAAMIWLWLYNPKLGLINRLIEAVIGGLGIHGPNWLGDPSWSMIALIIMSLWSVGPFVVIHLAALRDVPGELLEAATLDGLGPLARFRHITLPMISPVILFNVIVGLINAWQVFVIPFIMTKGGPDRATYFYSMYLYDAAFDYGRMGYACALGWIQLIIVLATTALCLGVGRRVVYERAP